MDKEEKKYSKHIKILSATVNRSTVGWCGPILLNLGTTAKDKTSRPLFSPAMSHWGQADLAIACLRPLD